MSTSSPSNAPGHWLVSTLLFTVLGLVLGFVLSSQSAAGDASPLFAFATGFAWSFLILQWIDIATQAIAFFSDPLPDETDLNDRDAVARTLDHLPRSHDFGRRIGQLLTSFGNSRDVRATIDLAAFQSSRARRPVYGGGLLVVLLLAPALLAGSASPFVLGGVLLLGLTLLAKLSLLSRIDIYLESRLLARLSSSLPGAGATAGELGKDVAKAIESALGQYLPKPDALAQVMKEASGDLKDVQTTLSTALSSAGKEAAEQLNATLSEYADKLETTNKALVGQLVKVTEVEQNIEKILHVQQAVDSTMQAVSASGEFKELVSDLRRHLSESDKAIKELAKPRSITLIEQDGEVTSA